MRGKAFFLAISLGAFAPGGWSMVVSDPTSYSYYVEQIKQAAEALKTAKQTVDEVKAVHNQVTGVYNRARGMVNDMKGAAEAARGAEGVLTRIGKGQGQTVGDDGFIDIDKVINGTFGDPRSRRGMEGADARHQVQQQALKTVINDSEKLLQGIGDRLDRVKDLASQIDSTANIKDSMDLSNRIAVEILKTLIDLLGVAAKANQAQALFNYSGVTDTTQKERERILKDANQKMQSVGDVLRTSGRFGNGFPRLGGF